MPADDKEWSRHATSEAHVRQLGSLQTYGVLGHMPDEGLEKLLLPELHFRAMWSYKVLLSLQKICWRTTQLSLRSSCNTLAVQIGAKS